MRHPIRCALFVTLLLAACGDDDGTGAGDAATPDAAVHPDAATGADAATPDAATGDAGPGIPCDPTVHEGPATYYAATGGGACGFPETPDDLAVVALNPTDFDGSNACGACVHVAGPLGEVTVRVVDLCPGCGAGHIDLGEDAFAAIANPDDGIVDVTWRVVPCAVTGPVVYHFIAGSSQWWTSVQVRNHRNPIARFEYLGGGGSFVEVGRLEWNEFAEADGMGVGPYTFRVTDVYGQSLTDVDVPFVDGADVPGGGQFPACE